MLTLPHALKEIPTSLRAEVQDFLKAVERARRFGFLIEVDGQGVMSGGAEAAIGIEWLSGGLGLVLPGGAHALAEQDIALVRRGLLQLLPRHDDDSALGHAQVLAASMPEMAGEEAASSLPTVIGASSTNFREPFHLHLWFAVPVEDPVLDALADALDTFEHLAVGMRPLDGDVFADIGATSLSLLEPDHVQIWIDGAYADPADWQQRVGRMLGRLHRRVPLRAVVYDES
ncbi:MAG: hypothetical protein EOP37_21640 [Rubrivivax sp.]|nr:MAG: hypothetical protein EOP37_21640 [Rubrivivax sp.]